MPSRYALGISIPQEVMQCDSMKSIWHETNMIISLYVYLPAAKFSPDLSDILQDK